MELLPVVQLVEVVYRIVLCSMFQVDNSLWLVDIIFFVQFSYHQGIQLIKYVLVQAEWLRQGWNFGYGVVRH